MTTFMSKFVITLAAVAIASTAQTEAVNTLPSCPSGTHFRSCYSPCDERVCGVSVSSDCDEPTQCAMISMQSSWTDAETLAFQKEFCRCDDSSDYFDKSTLTCVSSRSDCSSSSKSSSTSETAASTDDLYVASDDSADDETSSDDAYLGAGSLDVYTTYGNYSEYSEDNVTSTEKSESLDQYDLITEPDVSVVQETASDDYELVSGPGHVTASESSSDDYDIVTGPGHVTASEYDSSDLSTDPEVDPQSDNSSNSTNSTSASLEYDEEASSKDESYEQCPYTMEYRSCGSACDVKVCGEAKITTCIAACVPGCYCKDSSKWFDTNKGRCVSKSNCSDRR